MNTHRKLGLMATIMLAAVLSASPGCNHNTYLLVTVTGVASMVSRLDVTTTNGGMAAHDSYQPEQPFLLPATFTLEVDSSRQGPATVAVAAIGIGGAELARGEADTSIVRGSTVDVTVSLLGDVDGGIDAASPDMATSPPDLNLGPIQWTRSVPFDQNNLFGVWGSSAGNVFVVGGSGDIWRSTTPGSLLFVPMTSTIQTQLNAIWGSGPDDIYAVGNQGVIIHWNGVDAVWTSQVTNTVNPVFGVWGSGPGDVWAVGGQLLASGMILHTSNGGGTWTLLTMGSDVLNAVWGSTPTDVFAVGDNGALFHFDGQSWTQQGSGTQSRLWGVWGSSASDVYAVGEGGAVLHTSDHGAKWSPIPVSGAKNFNAVWGTDAGNVYVVGDTGTVVHLVDGQNPTLEAPVTQNSLHGIWGSGPRDIYAVGSAGTVIHGK